MRKKAGTGKRKADPSGGRKGIGAMEIGLTVLDALARATEPLPLKDISRLAGTSASQTHRYLASLMRKEMVIQDPTSGRYDLGKMALRVGLAALNRIEALQIAEEALRALVDRVHETGMLCIWGERGPVAIKWRRGRALIMSSVGVGTQFPLLATVSGQVFLAYMPPLLTRPILKAELAERAAKGHAMSRAEVDDLIARVRAQGFALADGHIVPGLRAICAPILDFQGNIVAALTLVGNTGDAKQKRDPAVGELLRVTGEASERLGFSSRAVD